MVASRSTWPPPLRRRSASEERRSPSSSERTSSRSRSGCARRVSASSSASASSRARTATRCSPCGPVRPELARAGRDPDLVEVRASARRSPAHVTREPCLEHVRLGARGLIAKHRAVEAQVSGPLGERRAESLDRHRARRRQGRSRLDQPRRPRLDGVETRSAFRDTAKRRIPLAERRGVVRWQRRARRVRAGEHPVDVEPPHRRPCLDNSEPVGGEDERRRVAPQPFERLCRDAVHAHALSLPRLPADFDRSRAGVSVALDPRDEPVAAEAGKVRVIAGTWRDPLRRHVHRLEQVRLASPVRADGEHEPSWQIEVERGIRPEVLELQARDDQIAFPRPSRRGGSA